MVKYTSFVVSVCFGALLATPAWHPRWVDWQTHRARLTELESLEDVVQRLGQSISAQATQPDAESPLPAWAPQRVTAKARDALLAHDLQVLQWQAGLPFTLKDTEAWLCPVQVQAQGAASSWFQAWQDMRAQLPGSVIARLQWQATPALTAKNSPAVSTSEGVWHMQLALPCAVHAVQDAPLTHDPFSAAQWQALHAQHWQNHPDVRAIQRHWQAPASPLTRVPLDQWRYVGFMHNAERQVALLQNLTQEASVQVVHVGQSMGTQWGEVTHIAPDALTVQEWLRDASGVWRRQTTRLPLHSGVAASKDKPSNTPSAP